MALVLHDNHLQMGRKIILEQKIHSRLGIVTIIFLNHTIKYAHSMIIVE